MSEASNRRKSPIRWWQVWRYSELKCQNEGNLVALVRERPDFTEADANFFMALCKSGRKTPEWIVDKMTGTKRR
jgi:hypothetical protein